MKKSRKISAGIISLCLMGSVAVIPAVAPEMSVTAYAEEILQDAENIEVPSTTEIITTIQSATESTTTLQTSESIESIQTTTESTTVLQTSETTEDIQTATNNIETISQNVKSTNKQLSDMIDMSTKYGAVWNDLESYYIYNMVFQSNSLKIETPNISPQETIQFEIGEMTGDNTFSLINGNMQLGEGDYITNQTGTLKVIDYNTIQIDFIDSNSFYISGFSKTFVNIAPKATTTTKSTTMPTTTTTTVTVATAGSNLAGDGTGTSLPNGTATAIGTGVINTTTATKPYPAGTTTEIKPSGNNGTTTALSGNTVNSGTTVSGSSQPENNSNNSNNNSNNNSSNSNSNSNSSSSSTGKSSPKTSDAGVGIAVTGIAIAAGMAFVARKKKD